MIYEEFFDFTLSSGERLTGHVDPEWRKMPKDSVQLVAKTIDLKSACEQFPICPEHREYCLEDFAFW